LMQGIVLRKTASALANKNVPVYCFVPIYLESSTIFLVKPWRVCRRVGWNNFCAHGASLRGSKKAQYRLHQDLRIYYIDPKNTEAAEAEVEFFERSIVKSWSFTA
jgi:hypothetical protein